MINNKIVTCESCCNFILCGIKAPDINVFKCSAYLNITKAKKYFKNVKNLTNGVFSKEMKK